MLLVAYLIVFVCNIIPFFMPPTWVLLAFFHVRYDPPIWLLTPGGALCATAGRYVLARLSSRFGMRFLRPREQANARYLGRFLKRRRWSYAGVVLYAFGPIPSPHLFIAAGLAGLDLRLVAAAFFVGRLVSYTTLVIGASAAADRLEPLFLHQFASGFALVGPLTAAMMVLVLVKLDWFALLRRWERHHSDEAIPEISGIRHD